MRNPFSRLMNACRSIYRRYSDPLRLELSLVDHCNLNCKGCTHYCPIAPEHFMLLDELDRNLGRLAKVDNSMFKSIYLLGGEPLLHPGIAQACRIARRHFPGAELKLLTNGMKVCRMPDDFWQACRETDTVISVTVYPVMIDYDAIRLMCNEQNVRYEIFHQPVDGAFFSKHTIDDVNPGNRHLNFLHCYQIGCLTLRAGRIYPCSTSAYADLVNEAFGRNFAVTHPRDGRRHGDYVEVDAVKARRDLLRLKNCPTRFCRYCTRLEPTDWAPSRREPSEWLPVRSD